MKVVKCDCQVLEKMNNSMKLNTLPFHHTLVWVILLEQYMPEFPQLTLAVNEALKTENNTINQIARYNNNV
jgi:hypothetical protein